MQGRIQNLFADAQMLRRDLQEFICVYKVQRLFQRKNPGRSESQRFVGRGGTGVGQLFFLTHIDLDIFAAPGLADHHA